MTKEESTILKGVAILLMLFLHLFNNIENVNLLDHYLYINNLPLSFILTRAASPVSWFIILSGYGLYITHHRGKYDIISKLKKLYIHYWISLLIFVPLAFFVIGNRAKYPGDIFTVLKNVTGWDTTYNDEIWFLFPYVMVLVTSKWIIKSIDKCNKWKFFTTVYFLFIISCYLISRYGAKFLFNNQLLYKPILYLQFLCPFTLGAYMAKYQIPKLINKRLQKTFDILKKLHINIYWSIIIAIVIFECSFKVSFLYPLYPFALIILLLNAHRWHWVDVCLTKIGRRSTSIWFTHTYFCYYMFHDFIYGCKFPIFVFTLLLICSYISAMIIDWVNTKTYVLFPNISRNH